jgi:solute carrier family 45 protein 1/2/4
MSTPHPVLFQNRHSEDSLRHSIDGTKPPLYASSTSTSTEPTPRSSRPTLVVDTGSGKESEDPSPLIAASSRMSEENEVSLVLHHHPQDDSDSDSDSDRGALRPRSTSPRLPGKAGKDTADKAGVILGIHNVFLVLPQFIVTILSAIIFHLMEPDNANTPKHPGTTIPIVGNVTGMDSAGVDGSESAERFVMRLIKREGLVEASSGDAVGVIFKVGGVSAAIGAFICMRLARSWRRGQGV